MYATGVIYIYHPDPQNIHLDKIQILYIYLKK